MSGLNRFPPSIGIGTSGLAEAKAESPLRADRAGFFKTLFYRLQYEFYDSIRVGLSFWGIVSVVTFLYFFPRFLPWVVAAEVLMFITFGIGVQLNSLQNSYQVWRANRREYDRRVEYSQRSEEEEAIAQAMIQEDTPIFLKLLHFEKKYGISSAVIMQFVIEHRVPPTVNNLDYITWVGLINKHQIEMGGEQ